MRTAIKPLIKHVRQKGQTNEQADDEPAKPKGQIVEFFPGRIPLSDLKAIWNDDDETYSDEDLLQIRDWLYMVAELSLKIMSANAQVGSGQPSDHASTTKQTKPTCKIIPLSPSVPVNEITEESYTIHPRLDRRAS